MLGMWRTNDGFRTLGQNSLYMEYARYRNVLEVRGCLPIIFHFLDAFDALRSYSERIGAAGDLSTLLLPLGLLIR